MLQIEKIVEKLVFHFYFFFKKKKNSFSVKDITLKYK